MTSLAATADEAYAAFRDLGIDVDRLPADVAASRITARVGVAPAILPAMDDWVAARSKVKDEAATRRLVNVLKAADPDP